MIWFKEKKEENKTSPKKNIKEERKEKTPKSKLFTITHIYTFLCRRFKSSSAHSPNLLVMDFNWRES